MTPLFVFTADEHVARSAWSRSGIDGDAHFAITQVVDLCVDRGVPWVSGGDFWDSMDPDPSDVRLVREQLDRLESADLPMYFWQGNHDKQPTPWLLAIHRWPTYIHGYRVPLGDDLWIYGLDYQSPSRLAEALAAVPETNILGTHQAWKELMGGQAESDGSLALVPDHVGHVLNGDLHLHLHKSIPTEQGPIVDVYSNGSLCMQSIDEAPGKACWLFGLDDVFPDGLVAESVHLRRRWFTEYNLVNEDELESFVVHEAAFLQDAAAAWAAQYSLPEALHKPLVRVKFNDDLPDAARRLRAACVGKFHLHLTPMERATTVAGIDRRTLVQALVTKGMKGVLADMPIEAEDPDAVRRDVASLLDAEVPAVTLEELCRS